MHFFKKEKFAIDLKGNDKLKSANNKFLKITLGTIDIAVGSGIYPIDDNLKLENGEVATGIFCKDFDKV
jgi:hypothetical protein